MRGVRIVSEAWSKQASQCEAFTCWFARTCESTGSFDLTSKDNTLDITGRDLDSGGIIMLLLKNLFCPIS